MRKDPSEVRLRSTAAERALPGVNGRLLDTLESIALKDTMPCSFLPSASVTVNGTSPVTIAIDSTVATLNGTQTFTNKSISGSTNTLTNIPNSALDNSSLTIGSTAISLGGTATSITGLTSLTLTQDPVSSLQAATKQYVDSIASGINFHTACYYATTVDLGTVTYNSTNEYVVPFTPTSVGVTSFRVLFGGVDVAGSPVTMMVF